MATRIKTGALTGIDGLAVVVEVDICRGLPGFHLVGLPNAEVRESRERVLAALRNSQVRPPPGKITVNLAPADVRKVGAAFDLAIAIAVVAAEDSARGKQIPHNRIGALFLGELSLFGELRPVRGLLAIVLAAAQRGEQCVVVPQEQAWEAELVRGIQVIGVETLSQAVLWWRKGHLPKTVADNPAGAVARPCRDTVQADWGALANLRGLDLVRKAAVVAAVGGHSLLMIGPPGTGKSRLARIMGRLQAPLADSEALEITRIHSAAGALGQSSLVRNRPFRAPHHSLTKAGLIGGGASLQPGEVTLAHGGMLFLDELTEYSPAVLDVLREPLESGQISIARGGGRRCFPARFQLIAAMNPCRCGYLGSQIRQCRCRPSDQARYLGRLSGPLLDRFELFVEVGAWQGQFLGKTRPKPVLDATDWRNQPQEDHIEDARRRLAAIRATGVGVEVDSVSDLEPEAVTLLERIRKSFGLSLRAVGRCIRVSRTIAALDGRSTVGAIQIREALEFRQESVVLFQRDR